MFQTHKVGILYCLNMQKIFLPDNQYTVQQQYHLQMFQAYKNRIWYFPNTQKMSQAHKNCILYCLNTQKMFHFDNYHKMSQQYNLQMFRPDTCHKPFAFPLR